MKRNYKAEIKELQTTLESVDDAVGECVAKAVGAHQPMIFVGSGGALAAARLASDLHIHSTGYLATAMTPLEAATADVSSETGLVLFSAQGRNPDATLAIRSARRRGSSFLGVVSSRSRDELPPALGASDVHVATVPSPRDGFLATNSLVAMAASLCVAHGAELPATLPGLSTDGTRPLRNSCLVVTGPGLAAIGVDLEARLVETGLASVQLADYRNLAHGRHVGLQRNADTSTVIVVVDPSSEEIATRTMELLPSDLDVVVLRTALPWPVSVLDLLVQSIGIVASTGESAGVDPGCPGVAGFGRRLYHLPAQKLVETPSPDPVGRKLLLRDRAGPMRQTYEDALIDWLQVMQRTAIQAVVLDYDGTVCSTEGRYDSPHEKVQHEIERLLNAGLRIGFATGRGKSLHMKTRDWLPEAHWPHVHVGLYNGTHLLRLADDPPEATELGDHLQEAVRRLRDLGSVGLVFEERPTQLLVSHGAGATKGSELLPLIRSVLSREPRLSLQAVASGHSVDVIESEAGKMAVLRRVARDIDGGAVLAIGDQGQVDGNDFQLLASCQTTLSVDRCSLDPTRCWNLDRRGEKGPDLLIRYLRSLKPRGSGARFVWKLS
ncbi:MAG: hypothetical protein KTV16_13795 [Acidimicrobiia bacterium]|nr:hypothetical protein [Acidimicrobiia bacterium]